jgi:hypothetical protein
MKDSILCALVQATSFKNVNNPISLSNNKVKKSVNCKKLKRRKVSKQVVLKTNKEKKRTLKAYEKFYNKTKQKKVNFMSDEDRTENLFKKLVNEEVETTADTLNSKLTQSESEDSDHKNESKLNETSEKESKNSSNSSLVKKFEDISLDQKELLESFYINHILCHSGKTNAMNIYSDHLNALLEETSEAKIENNSD